MGDNLLLKCLTTLLLLHMEVSCGFPGGPELLLVKHLLVYLPVNTYLGEMLQFCIRVRVETAVGDVFSSPKQSE